MNIQKKYWSTENKCEVPLHGIKFCVWYTLIVRRITGPVFFAGKINSERHVRQMLQVGLQYCCSLICVAADQLWKGATNVVIAHSRKVLLWHSCHIAFLCIVCVNWQAFYNDRLHTAFCCLTRIYTCEALLAELVGSLLLIQRSTISHDHEIVHPPCNFTACYLKAHLKVILPSFPYYSKWILFQEVSPTKTLCAFLVTHILAPWPVQHTLLGFTLWTVLGDLYYYVMSLSS